MLAYIYNDEVLNDDNMLWWFNVTQNAMKISSVIFIIAILLLSFNITILSIIGYVCIGLVGLVDFICILIQHFIFDGIGW